MCDILKHTTMKTGDKTMKKIHRTLSLFTVAAMCAALLCSCGEVPDSSQTDSSSKAATTTTADTTADTQPPQGRRAVQLLPLLHLTAVFQTAHQR